GAIHSIAGPPLGTVDYALASQRYGELLELGLSLGVKPAMEYLGFAADVNSIADALRIIDGAGHPQGTVVLDPFHDFRSGAGCEDIVRLEASQIAISHFDDAPATPTAAQQSDADRVMPGEGVIDLARYVALLEQVGYDGWISLELFRPDLWASDPQEVARIGLEKMRAVCEPA
ncbi:MAG: sugar phosphate isomerase/epimerase, partial [Planctomycetaceae bacterium]|nr:sugar phosphate isomerase/epimerase [Planctomycetaceae bacterium]